MQIVINIDDEEYDDITLTGENTINLGVLLDLREAVRKGIQLPRGHGDLIDKNDLKYEKYNSYAYAIANAPIIIEADKECEAKTESEET